ncbi:hypothetical protein JCM16814_07450 [Desulfobaculum senezii]|jgi:hypothetical protein
MGMKKKMFGWAIRKQIEAHSDEIQAEVERVKGIRSVSEAKDYGKEKIGQAREVWQEHGPGIKDAAQREWDRMKKRLKDADK